MRCYKDIGHKGRHGYTPQGLLSPSILTSVLLELTSGQIKSRAGLDNIDVTKGHDNFQEMINILQSLSFFGKVDEMTCNDLSQKIEDAETFRKVDFPQHLGKSNNICACFKCGFHCDKLDPIPCSCRGNHKSPCKGCQESFEVLMELYDIHNDVSEQFSVSERSIREPHLNDDLLTIQEDIVQCFNSLKSYRTHIAHKISEAMFDQEYYRSLEPEQAVVVSDWKMKILASRYRESQQEWFSKRGSSCLGIEIHLYDKSAENKKKVIYHFFFSDDTTQDAKAVLCAKHFLYTVVLPSYGVKQVKFRSDGAACFSAKECKAAMRVWDELNERVGASYEVAYKIMVAGCGKTALDGKQQYSRGINRSVRTSNF